MSRAALVLTLILPFSAAAQATSTPGPLDAGERVTAALTVLAPGTTDPTLEPRLLAALRAQTHAATGLELVSAASLGVPADALTACPPQRLLTCAVGVMNARGARADVLLVLSVLSLGDGQVQLRAIGLDLTRARAVLDDHYQRRDDESTPESRLYGQAFEGPIVELALRDDAALAQHLAALATALPAALPIAAPLGTIALHSPTAGTLALDDRPLGAVAAGPTTLAHVRPGTRALRLVGADGAVFERVVDVKSARIARLGLEIELSSEGPPPGDWAGARQVVGWGGLAVAASGAALMVVSTAGSGVRQGCLTRGGDATCSGLGALTFGFDATGAPTTDADRINPPGLAPLPLGAALLAAGATWGLGALLLGDERDHPWWVVAGGVAGGVLSFALVGLAAQ